MSAFTHPDPRCGCLGPILPGVPKANSAGAASNGAGSLSRKRSYTSAIARANGEGPAKFRRRYRRYCADRILSSAVNCLRQAAGGIVSPDELADWIWGGRADGGPECTDRYLGLIVMELRRRGFPIVNEWGRGYRYASSGRVSP